MEAGCVVFKVKMLSLQFRQIYRRKPTMRMVWLLVVWREWNVSWLGYLNSLSNRNDNTPHHALQLYILSTYYNDLVLVHLYQLHMGTMSSLSGYRLCLRLWNFACGSLCGAQTIIIISDTFGHPPTFHNYRRLFTLF